MHGHRIKYYSDVYESGRTLKGVNWEERRKLLRETFQK